MAKKVKNRKFRHSGRETSEQAEQRRLKELKTASREMFGEVDTRKRIVPNKKRLKARKACRKKGDWS
jgi:hypothetical protein